MKNLNLSLVIGMISMSTFLGVGCGGSNDNLPVSGGPGPLVQEAVVDTALPVSDTVVITPRKLHGISRVSIAFNKNDADEEMLITAKAGNALSLSFDAEGNNLQEIQKNLSHSPIDRLFDNLIVFVGGRPLGCERAHEKPNHHNRELGWMCIRKLVVTIPRGLKVDVNAKGTELSSLPLHVGETIRFGNL